MTVPSNPPDTSPSQPAPQAPEPDSPHVEVGPTGVTRAGAGREADGRAITPYDPDARYKLACDLIATGLATRVAAAQAGTDVKSLWSWVKRTEANSDLYARARDMQARALADETLTISDAADPTTVQVAKLRTDTRKWLASKHLPKEYGEKLEVDAKVEVVFRLTRE